MTKVTYNCPDCNYEFKPSDQNRCPKCKPNTGQLVGTTPIPKARYNFDQEVFWMVDNGIQSGPVGGYRCYKDLIQYHIDGFWYNEEEIFATTQALFKHLQKGLDDARREGPKSTRQSGEEPTGAEVGTSSTPKA